MNNEHQPLNPEPQTPNDDQPSYELRATSYEDSVAKCQEYLDGWKRAKADYDNLKKDFEKSRVDIAE